MPVVLPATREGAGGRSGAGAGEVGWCLWKSGLCGTASVTAWFEPAALEVLRLETGKAECSPRWPFLPPLALAPDGGLHFPGGLLGLRWGGRRLRVRVGDSSG